MGKPTEAKPLRPGRKEYDPDNRPPASSISSPRKGRPMVVAPFICGPPRVSAGDIHGECQIKVRRPPGRLTRGKPHEKTPQLGFRVKAFADALQVSLP